MTDQNRDFNLISPSAEFLIRLKASTTIPFAKETAALLLKGAVADAAERSQTDFSFYFRQMIHFENRYRTIDKILSEIAATNFLEISSGYSFRGLNLCLEKNCNFIDTDLPELIAEKKKVIIALLENNPGGMKGHLELVALNALNKPHFAETVRKLPEGNLVIINEGLLPYLNNDEKKILFSNIYDALQSKGGYWITGDIYIRENERETKNIPEEARKWREMHRIEENKFEDFETAEKFYNECGFDVIRRESFAIEELSCLQLLGDKRNEIVEKMRASAPNRQTWCLKISGKKKVNNIL